MATNSKNIALLKKDPVADASDTFNITTMLNNNWDKVDLALPFKITFAAADWVNAGTEYTIEIPTSNFTAAATLGTIAYASWYNTVNSVLTPIDNTWLGQELTVTISSNKVYLHSPQAFAGACLLSLR